MTPHNPSDVLLIPLSTGVLSELKIVTYFFVKTVEKFESRSCTIERRLAFLKFGYEWAYVDFDGNIGICRCP